MTFFKTIKKKEAKMEDLLFIVLTFEKMRKSQPYDLQFLVFIFYFLNGLEHKKKKNNH